MTGKQKFALAFAGIVAFIYTLVGCLAIAGISFFRPSFHYGPLVFNASELKVISKDALMGINQMAIDEIAMMALVVVGLSLLQRLAQWFLSQNRPVGRHRVREGIIIDLVTSFAPITITVLVFVIVRIFVPYESWWLWPQALFALIIISEMWGDAGSTIRYCKDNWNIPPAP